MTGSCLNQFCPEPVDSSRTELPSREIFEDLGEALTQLYGRILSRDGQSVDYSALREMKPPSKLYQIWHRLLRLVYRFQRLNLSDCTRNERLVFFLNVYNLLTIHGILEGGNPETFFQKLRFYAMTSYAIGGRVYSMNDIEHGILRANQRMPFWFRRQFCTYSHKARYSIRPFDPRIHFAINCGVKSGAKIRVYDVERLDEQLSLAAAEFISNESNLAITFDEENHQDIVSLSQVFYLFPKDFASVSTSSSSSVEHDHGELMNIVLQLKTWLDTRKDLEPTLETSGEAGESDDGSTSSDDSTSSVSSESKTSMSPVQHQQYRLEQLVHRCCRTHTGSRSSSNSHRKVQFQWIPYYWDLNDTRHQLTNEEL